MNPFLRDGDLVTIRPCAVVRPRQGDIVAFVHPDSGQLLLHRVIGKTKCAYLTQGDNALQNDGLIAERHVLGAVTEVVRARRRVRRSLGPERLLIVFLIRLRLLSRLLSLLRRFRKTSMLRSESEF
jgi:signal peptidase I